MNLSRGEPWGALETLSADVPLVENDRALAVLLERTAADTHQVVALSGGDLCHTLGGRGDVESRLGKQAMLAPVDVGIVRLDGDTPRVFCAHVVARGRFWSGEGLVVMNAQWLGKWRVAPRSHPGDGLLDVVVGTLSARQRFLARGRATTGDHIPHPELSTSRGASFEHVFKRRRRVYLDGAYVGRYRRVSVSIRSAAVTVAV